MIIENLENKLKVVFDTNIYFSIFLNKKNFINEIWKLAVQRKFIVLTSSVILNELAEVLKDKLFWEGSKVTETIKIIAKVAEIIAPSSQIYLIEDDHDDDRILECALDGKADLIVSGDKHLLKLKSFENIGIVRPLDFLKSLPK